MSRPLVVHAPGPAKHVPPYQVDDGQLVAVLDAPERVQALLAGACSVGARPVDPDPFDPACLLTVHDAALLDYLQTAWHRWSAVGLPGPVVPDSFGPRDQPRAPGPNADVRALAGFYCRDTATPIIEDTWWAAAEAAAVAITAARVVDEGARLAYALCRPPGHHASRAEYSGFCYLNNAVLAARRLGAGVRVAMVDLDFHHGNGTQDLVWDDPDIFYGSLHGPPDRHFPFFSGFADERGGPGAEDTIHNVPLPDGAGGQLYLDRLAAVLERVKEFRPDRVVVSLGLDIARSDPVGTFLLDAEDLYQVGTAVGGLALPTVVVQEGGYSLAGLTEQVAAVLGGMQNALDPMP